MTTTTGKVEVIGVTLTGAIVGFLVAGPIGLGIGLTLGSIADLLILKAKTAPVVMPQGTPAVLASAVISAAVTPTAPVGPAVMLSYTVNGLSVSEQYAPNASALPNDIVHAYTLAALNHGAGKEGERWKAYALADGAGPTELAALRASGYAV